MSRSLRATLIFVIVVATLIWGTNAVIERATGLWVAHDTARRAQFALRASGSALADQWRRGDTVALRRVLSDISRDDQVLGMAVCGSQGPTVRTERFPGLIACGAVPVWGDSAHLSLLHRPDSVFAFSMPGSEDARDRVIVLHDVRYSRLRVAQMRAIVFGGFAVFALLAIVLAFLDRWLLNQRWVRELRDMFGSFTEATDRETLLTEIRGLAARASVPAATQDHDGMWTRSRLRDLVHETLDDAQVIILANREPLIHQKGANGAVTIVRPASGLVSALEPVIRACSGSWVAHGAGSADPEYVDANDRLEVPPADEAYTLRRVWLTPEEESGYYYGLANEGLWPLCHTAHARPVFRSSDMEHYREVNLRFVNAVCEEARRDDPMILVQDYHFALAPRMIRQRLPDATIVAFWHIPWPNAERFGICPWRNEIIEGMLGASILGFHTQQHCNNFTESVDAFIEARVDREVHAIERFGVQTLVRPYPISVEWSPRWADAAPSADVCRQEILAELGLPADALIGIGVDRLDYTKGIEERFLAVERMLELAPSLCGRFTFIQVAAPSRTNIPRYSQFTADVLALAERINARFDQPGCPPITLRHQHHDHVDLARFYRAADVCYVSSLHDGMNLVAKEFVATRDDERGVLMLSSFTGAARELTEAIVVNPYDIDGAGAAMLAALQMSDVEERERMRAMRAVVRDFNVFRWAGRILADAGRERRRMRLARRLTRVSDVFPVT